MVLHAFQDRDPLSVAQDSGFAIYGSNTITKYGFGRRHVSVILLATGGVSATSQRHHQHTDNQQDGKAHTY
jgi:hypothetical protein